MQPKHNGLKLLFTLHSMKRNFTFPIISLIVFKLNTIVNVTAACPAI